MRIIGYCIALGVVIAPLSSCKQPTGANQGESGPTSVTHPSLTGPPPAIAPCELATKALAVQDWLPQWSAHFPVEKGGLLLRLEESADGLSELKQSLAWLNGFQLVPCRESMLLWVSCTRCGSHSDTWQTLLGHLKHPRLIHHFDDYGVDVLGECLANRLPLDRCRQYATPMLTHCDSATRQHRLRQNKLLSHLGLIPAGSRACLRPDD
jgi:hypothetical protein